MSFAFLIWGRKIQAFTLVELIVVITVLSILATISFVAYQSYTKGARDSVRMANVSIIAQGLETTAFKWIPLPTPVNSVIITASGTTNIIGYQWRADKSILVGLGIGESLDPSTKDSYVYAIDANKEKSQVITLLEDSAPGSIFSKGDNLGMLLGADVTTTQAASYSAIFGSSSIPVDSVLINTGSVDVYKTFTGYTAAFASNILVSGTGWTLGSIYSLYNSENTTITFLDSTLIGYWNMNNVTNSGSQYIISDLSQSGNYGILSSATSSEGISGKWMLFGDGKGMWIKRPFASNPSAATFSFWVKPINTKSVSFIGYTAPIWNVSYQRGMGFYYVYTPNADGRDYNDYSASSTIENSFHVYNAGNTNTDIFANLATSLPQNIWSHVVFSFDGTAKTFTIYVNGVAIWSVSNSSWSMLALFNTQTTDWIIGDTNYTSNVSDTYFDEIRFYNRTLSASEVAALYGSVQ